MTDVRSLLRNERASRRINHPYASYTSSGSLLCSLCGIQIKTEGLWEKHLRSSQHNIRLQQSCDDPPPTKKRKAGGTEEEGRKRARGGSDDIQDATAPQITITDASQEDLSIKKTESRVAPPSPEAAPANEKPPQAQSTASAPGVDEEEWAAFERDIAALEQPQRPAAYSATATISAAPMTAEEIAAQAREEQSQQRGQRDIEIEAEKEDAARALEQEFDEMEDLEERVRKLREKREALRLARENPEKEVDEIVNTESLAPSKADEELEEDDEEDDDEAFDDWTFGAR